MEHYVSIKDVTIKYQVIRRKIKNPRLEFREGRFKLILPADYTGHEERILSHKRWIYNRHMRVQSLLAASREIELEHKRSEEQLKELVRLNVLSIGSELGVQPDAIRFRKMTSKWGSCSSRNNLNFNTYMRYLPEELIEYVVYHEMVHLIELNHSPRFWSYIRSRFEDHKSYEEQLSNYWYLIQKHLKE